MAMPEIFSASNLEGDKVINSKGEELGKIKDVVLDVTNDSIAYVVISFGGFMGVANKLFGVPIEALKKKPGEDVFVLNVEKERLKDAPGFDKDKWPGISGEAQMDYAACIYGYYGYECPYQSTEILGESERTWDRSLEQPSGRTIEEMGGIKEEGKTLEGLGGIKEEGRTLKGSKRKSE
ncbi:PRC-barrel domain-containing protein [Methanolobus zinderi]|jgi:sporulation protein YlmC with PRC-barrel domain|uniref:PRC-barrel domain-containing protein n=1 Tax=Methanolobus zinderi TaxID=536044 RepID=A0A7D5E9K9_9EURY|nr:PRC-barrel domain-containing protein [Methanolobus zinderi]QLC50537.1 PRC-barrel domain-containing protein [Methanolobus zinderi]